MFSILERLKQLEKAAAANIAVRYPDNNDNFITAVVGEAAEQYRHGSGYDVMAALCSTARDDWSDYEPPDNYSDDECQDD